MGPEPAVSRPVSAHIAPFGFVSILIGLGEFSTRNVTGAPAKTPTPAGSTLNAGDGTGRVAPSVGTIVVPGTPEAEDEVPPLAPFPDPCVALSFRWFQSTTAGGCLDASDVTVGPHGGIGATTNFAGRHGSAHLFSWHEVVIANMRGPQTTSADNRNTLVRREDTEVGSRDL